jgi:hypothetical protein
MRAIARRQHESRLREIELGGDGLHLRGRHAAGVEDDGQRIATEGSLGENIDGYEFDMHRMVFTLRTALFARMSAPSNGAARLHGQGHLAAE